MNDEELLDAYQARFSEAYEELHQAFIKFSLTTNDLTNQIKHIKEKHPTLFTH